MLYISAFFCSALQVQHSPILEEANNKNLLSKQSPEIQYYFFSPSEGCLGQNSVSEVVPPKFPESGSLEFINMSCYFQVIYLTNSKENL